MRARARVLCVRVRASSVIATSKCCHGVGMYCTSIHVNTYPMYWHVLWYVLWYVLVVCIEYIPEHTSMYSILTGMYSIHASMYWHVLCWFYVRIELYSCDSQTQQRNPRAPIRRNEAS